MKRLIRKSMNWYIGFIVHQIVKFAWSVSRMFHVVVDHVEDLEAAVEVQRMPPLPASVVPASDPGSSWWAREAVAAVSGVGGRVLNADCGSGTLVDALVAAGVDGYGVDPAEAAVEAAVGRGLDVRSESLLNHLEVVADAALDGMVVAGSVQWFHPNERDRLVGLVGTRLAVGGVLVLHSATPESWMGSVSPVISDLAPGRPLHAETWGRLLGDRGFRVTGVTYGGTDRRIEPVAESHPDAASVDAAIDAVNQALLGPGEYLLVAVGSGEHRPRGRGGTTGSAMKLSFVTPRYGTEVIGGAETAARMLAERLCLRPDWEVEVLTSCAMDHLTWENTDQRGRPPSMA